jgi:hypothetical protein
VFDEVIGYYVATVSSSCLYAKLRLDLALGDSGIRDGEGDYVRGRSRPPTITPLGIVLPNKPMKDF